VNASRSKVRALTIALFYAFGTLLGGVGGPWLSAC
jgi:zinc transporter ZupT